MPGRGGAAAPVHLVTHPHRATLIQPVIHCFYIIEAVLLYKINIEYNSAFDEIEASCLD